MDDNRTSSRVSPRPRPHTQARLAASGRSDTTDAEISNRHSRSASSLRPGVGADGTRHSGRIDLRGPAGDLADGARGSFSAGALECAGRPVRRRLGAVGGSRAEGGRRGRVARQSGETVHSAEAIGRGSGRGQAAVAKAWAGKRADCCCWATSWRCSTIPREASTHFALHSSATPAADGAPLPLSHYRKRLARGLLAAWAAGRGQTRRSNRLARVPAATARLDAEAEWL